jgi:threonyl-tRNA synthetase
MAKEQLHNWGRYVFLALVIVFASGGWVITVKSNTDNIIKNATKIEKVEDDIHKLELSDKDIANLSQKSVEFMTKIDSSLITIQQEQTKQALIQAVNSEKLKTLTKD